MASLWLKSLDEELRKINVLTMKDSRPPGHHREGVYNVYHAEEC